MRVLALLAWKSSTTTGSVYNLLSGSITSGSASMAAQHSGQSGGASGVLSGALVAGHTQRLLGRSALQECGPLEQCLLLLLPQLLMHCSCCRRSWGPPGCRAAFSFPGCSSR